MTTETYLTAREVAARLRIGLNTVYVLVRSGKLRAVKVGRVVRIPESAVRDYIAAGTTAEAGPAPGPVLVDAGSNGTVEVDW